LNGAACEGKNEECWGRQIGKRSNLRQEKFQLPEKPRAVLKKNRANRGGKIVRDEKKKGGSSRRKRGPDKEKKSEGGHGTNSE